MDQCELMVLLRQKYQKRLYDLQKSLARRELKGRIADDDTLETIKAVHARGGILVDPHGAVGIKALERYREGGDRTHAICVQTAHPGKFPDIMRDALSKEIAAPASFCRYAKRERRVDCLSADYGAFKRALMEMH